MTHDVRKKTSQSTIKIGSIEVMALQDGILHVPQSVLKPAEDPDLRKRLDAALSNPLVWSNSVYVFRIRERVILIDVGGGDLFPPESGRLLESMISIGLRPEDITDICLTHLHPDHIGGLAKDGQLVFPTATLHVSEVELAYWLAADSKLKAPEHHSVFFEALDKKFLPYFRAERVRTFKEGDELFPGLRTIPLPGHTPGLSAFVLASDGDALTFWGDLFNEPLQAVFPQLKLMFDWDSELAVKTREVALGQAALTGTLVAVPHAQFPGFSRVQKEGEGYQLVPVRLMHSGGLYAEGLEGND